MKSIHTSILLFLTLVVSSYAQSPTATAKTFHKLTQLNKYDEIGALFAPSALKELREIMRVGTISDTTASMVLPMFFGEGADKASVADLGDQEFFGIIMRIAMIRSGLASGIDFKNIKYLGEKRQGSLAYVITRYPMNVSERRTETVEPLIMRNEGGQWKLLLNDSMRTMAKELRSTLDP